MTIETLRRRLRGAGWRYTSVRDAKLLQTVAVDNGTLYVVGDPDNGSYEWVWIEGNGLTGDLHYSDAGWGSIAHALRDGLNVALAEPVDA